MSSIFNVGNNGGTDYSNLFSSMSGSASTQSSGNMLTDWASLKNGSMKKLTKAYYNKTETGTKKTVSDEAKEAIKANTAVKSDATDMKSSISSLQAAGTYEKKSKTDADGNTTTDYDYEKITSSLKDFVKSYNSVIGAAVDSENVGVLRNAAAMTRATAANKNLLSSIGISIGENNKLSLDEEAVKKTNINNIKSLFQGGGSYGSQIESSSSELINKINAENNKLSGYTANGSYSTQGASGSLYDGTY